MRKLLITFAILVAVGCTPEFEIDNPGIANRGILPLSTSDPFLGSNKFLAKQMEQSAFLHNFIKTRGAPLAIQVKLDNGEAPEMIMYYPRTKEVYAAERHARKIMNQKMPVADWIVRGPYAVERADYRELAPMEAATVGEPIFDIWGKQIRYNRVGATPPQTAQSRDDAVKPVLPPTPPPTPTPTPKPVKKATPAPTVDPEAAMIKNFKPMNSDQQALMMAKGYAERSDNGDVIHTVRSANESLTEIANWYAGATTHADDIASLNGIASKAAPLVPGQRVRIPLRLLKKVKAMP